MSDKSRRIGEAIKKAKRDKKAKAEATESETLGLGAEPAPAPLAEVSLLLTGSLIPLVRLAVTERADTLETLATANTKKGYPRQGRVVHADAVTLREHILPKLGPAIELGLHSPQEVRAGIAEGLRPILAPALAKGAKPELETLLGDIATRVEEFCRAVSDRSFAQGHSARELTAEAAMMQSLGVLGRSRTGDT